jgi:transposase
MLLEHIAALSEQIALLEKELRDRDGGSGAAGKFAKGRDFAAWVGVTPKENSSGGKTTLGATSKIGQFDLRRLLVSGAIAQVRWAARKGAPEGSWLARMMTKRLTTLPGSNEKSLVSNGASTHD